MPTRIFKVDLSDGARDYAPTATEPGLAMLDRQMANYGILRRWLGDFAAEPEFLADSVSFFIREEERGRLENIECYPATKSDLEGPLKADLDALSARVKKIRPDSRTEELLAKILKSTFNQLTNNLEVSDHDSFFFQYRERGQPWKLVWCWGYQRADLQPAPALICSNPQCNQLYVRRPNGDDECPGCTTRGGKRKGAWPFGLTVERLALAALALLLLLGLFLFMGQPKLAVEPREWHGPVGSVADFKVIESKYFLFRNDVTKFARMVSDDPRVLAVRNGKATAKAEGLTHLAITHNGLATELPVTVDPLSPPDSIRLEPKELHLGIGSVAHVKLIGHYDEGNRDVELSPDQAEWEIVDDKIAFGQTGFYEGAAEGKTQVNVRVLKSVFEQSYAEATLDVDVKDVKYEALVLGVSPDRIPVRDTAVVSATCPGKDGNAYDFMGSTRLTLSIEPSSVASLTADTLTGVSPGPGEVKGKIDAKLGGLTGTAPFQVGEPAPSAFAVSPKSLKIMEDEVFKFDVTGGGSETVMSKSSDDVILQVIGATTVVGRYPGKATVTISQGDKTATVEVEVVASEFTSLAITPPALKLKVGQVAPIHVTATTRDGRSVEVDPSRLVWVRQPPVENAYFDRDKMLISGLKTTIEAEPLICRLGRLDAAGSVQVTEEKLVAVRQPGEIDIGGDFIPYPPVPVGTKLAGGIIERRGKYYFGDDRSIIDSRLPPGATVTHINGVPLDGLSVIDREKLFAGVGPGSRVTYLNAEGLPVEARLGSVTGVQEVKVAGVRPVELSASDFKAEVLVDLRNTGEYRVTDDKGAALSDWKSLPAGPGSITTTTKIPRAESLDHDYKLYIEQKRGDKAARYEFQFKLESEGPKTPTVPAPAPAPASPTGGGAKSDLEALRKAGVAP